MGLFLLNYPGKPFDIFSVEESSRRDKRSDGSDDGTGTASTKANFTRGVMYLLHTCFDGTV